MTDKSSLPDFAPSRGGQPRGAGVRSFIAGDLAAAATEYAIILAFIALVCIGALASIGNTVAGPYNALATELSNVVGAG